MIQVLSSLQAWVRNRLPVVGRVHQEQRDPWVIFYQGRALENRGDTKRAFCCNLQAAKAGLPVAMAFAWMAYRTGDGIPTYPVAASAWAERARSAGWPEVLEPEGR